VSGERILVVDDSAQMRDLLANTVLGPEGYVVDLARDGVEGMAAALTHSPDLIITDLAMPEMNGLEMVEELRKAGHQFPVILMTAEGSEDIAVRALRAGVMDYFVKPFDPEALLEAVRRVLRAARIGALRAGVPDQRRLQALNTLIAIGKSVTGLLDLEMILGRVVEAAVYLSGADEGTLMLVDPSTGELYVRAAKNLESGLRNMRLPAQDSIAGRVISTGEPMLIGGAGMQKIKTHYLVHSLLYVPLKVQNRVIGVLGVHNRIADRPLLPQDIGIVTALADYAAIAIVNAQLYEQSETERTKLERILQQTQDAVLVVDYEGRIVLCNPAAHSVIQEGGTKEITGRWLSEVTQNHALLELMRYEPGSTTTAGEIQLEDNRVLSVHISEIKGLGHVAVMHDITHLKELDRIKSELVDMVSHQVRSPLTAILAYIELIARTGELNDQQKQFADQVKHNVRLITETITDLLELGRIEAGMDRQREVLDLSAVAEYAVGALMNRAEMKNQHLILRASEGIPPVLGNLARLRQMLVNLIDNAIKYTPEGGAIQVEVFEEAGQAVIRVTDTGIGIPLADQPHIFDKFYRGSDVAEEYEGTGLGLSIVKSIVDAHNGRIWVDSQPGKGTSFTIVLPAHIGTRT
jgi:signal transduction histidine kinase/CheY-like chemotaxis protein